MKSKSTTEINKICANCEHATAMYDEELVLCSRHGVVDAMYSCRRFIYDPLKRKVRRAGAPTLEFIDIDKKS